MPATNANHLQPARRNAVNRNKNPKHNKPALNSAILITDATPVGSVLTLTFNGIVTLDRGKVPQIMTDVAGPPAPTPVSAEQTAPNAVAITYSGAVATATTLTIPPCDPAIRNSSGGFVTSTTFPLAA